MENTNSKVFFVNLENLKDYIEKTIEYAIKNKEYELSSVECSANERVFVLDDIRGKLNVAFEMANQHYANAAPPTDLPESLIYDVTYLHRRVQIAYLVASRTYATFDDIIFALLAPAVYPPKASEGIKKLDIERIRSVFGESAAALLTSQKEKPETDDDVDAYIYAICEKKMIAEVQNSVGKFHGIANTAIVEKAYDYARRKHKNTYRLSGEPYIFHPLFVASTLARCGIDCDTVAAALLHDIVEDIDNSTLDEIERLFNRRIRNYVDAVSAIDGKNLPSAHYAARYERDERHRKTFEKLSEMVAENPDMLGALYIKAANRIHNLTTLDTVSLNVTLELINETEATYLMLFEKYGLTHFVNVMKSEMLRYRNKNRYYHISEGYATILKSSAPILNGYTYETKNRLTKVPGFLDSIKEFIAGFNNYTYLRSTFADQMPFNVEYVNFPYTLAEIEELLERYTPSEYRTSDLLPITKNNVNAARIFVVLSPNNWNYQASSYEKFVKCFITSSLKKFAKLGFTITDISYDKKFDQYSFIIVDSYQNRVELIITTKKNYYESLYGSFTAQDYVYPMLDNDPGEISVFKLDNTALKLKSGATALDFAYYLHAKLCLEAYEAIINGNRCRLGTILKNGDRVYICKNPDEKEGANKDAPKDGFVTRATVRYLKYTKDVNVQRYIINYLAKTMDGDDVFAEDVVYNDVFAAHLNTMMNINHAILDIEEEELV